MSQKFYAVKVGRVPGIYRTWEECKAQTDKYPCNAYKSFVTKKEAEAYMKDNKRKYDCIRTEEDCQELNKKRRLEEQKDENKDEEQSKEKEKEEKNREKNETIIVYTDGSCLFNGKSNAVCGIGVYFGKEDDPRNVSKMLPSNYVTNNQAEIMAVKTALEILESNLDSNVEIRTDSLYVIKSMTEWLNKWKEEGETKVLKKIRPNYSLLLECEALIKTRKGKVIWTHCSAHNGIKGNEMSDKLSTRCLKLPKKKNDWLCFKCGHWCSENRTKDHEEYVELEGFWDSKEEVKTNFGSSPTLCYPCYVNIVPGQKFVYLLGHCKFIIASTTVSRF